MLHHTMQSLSSHNLTFFFHLSFPSVSGAAGKERARFPAAIPSEALESPERNHERKCAQIGRIHRIAALSAKFSRFHSSQQCDERKAVKLSERYYSKSSTLVAKKSAIFRFPQFNSQRFLS